MLSLVFCLGCQSSSHSQPSEDFCKEIINAWKSIEDYPYVWGGNSVEEGGFDCSGAIYYISKVIGKPVPRTTSYKYYVSTNSERMFWKEAKCSYLIWWTFSPDRPYGHIGMHVHQPFVWQSGSSTGPTEIKMIKKGYWGKRFETSKKFY